MLLALRFPVWFAPSRDRDAADPSRRSRAHPGDRARVGDGEEEDVGAPAPLTAQERLLIERIRAGDADAFATLYTAHLELLVAFAYGYVHSEPAAQDLVADLFLHLWEIRATWAPRGGIRPYLLAAVRHRALNVNRDAARAGSSLRRAVVSDVPVLTGTAPAPADELVERAQRRSIIRRAIDQLAPDRRRAMLLRWQFGLTPEEIASAMGISRASVDQLVSRGLKTIRSIVRKENLP